MIKRINLWVIAFREIFLNKFLFGINVIVCCLLFGVSLSIMGIIGALPNELEQEVLNTEIGEIQVANIDYKDIEYLKRLPISLYSFGYDMDWSMFEDGLTNKQKKINSINNIDNSINFCLYNKKSSVLNDINSNFARKF